MIANPIIPLGNENNDDTTAIAANINTVVLAQFLPFQIFIATKKYTIPNITNNIPPITASPEINPAHVPSKSFRYGPPTLPATEIIIPNSAVKNALMYHHMDINFTPIGGFLPLDCFLAAKFFTSFLKPL